MKVQYVGRKPVPALVGVELVHVEGDVFECGTPELLPPSFQVMGDEPSNDQGPDADQDMEDEDKPGKKSRKHRGHRS